MDENKFEHLYRIKDNFLIFDISNEDDRKQFAIDRFLFLAKSEENTLYITNSKENRSEVYDKLNLEQIDFSKHLVTKIDTLLLNLINGKTIYNKNQIIQEDEQIYKSIYQFYRNKYITKEMVLNIFKEIVNNKITTIEEFYKYKTEWLTDHDKFQLFYLLEKCRAVWKSKGKMWIEDVYVQLDGKLNTIDLNKFSKNEDKNIENFKHIIVYGADTFSKRRYDFLKLIFNILKKKKQSYTICLICDLSNKHSNSFLDKEKVLKVIKKYNKIRYFKI